jgi:hypothetical protein
VLQLRKGDAAENDVPWLRRGSVVDEIGGSPR